ncbi:MAG: hypothetical protein DI611_02510 [Brachybacterium faecium]|nr:MAG: hypothetical protein DI611_02510 [Brachybacterium faecium]
MTYQPSFGPSYGPQSGSAYPQQPPPKRRGVKRTVFGAIGLVLNAFGLIVMPILGVLLGGVIGAMGMLDAEAIDASGGTFEASTMSIHYLAVPADAVETVTCEVEGQDVTIEPDTANTPVGVINGVEHVTVYTINTVGDQQVTVSCQGTDSLALSEMGMTGFFVSTVVSFIIPVVLGLASLVLLIWGIIALVRSGS